MLVLLKIRNIALIDELTIEFEDGMNCLTGETGAGKSIIIDSIGCESAYTEGVFYTEDRAVSEFLKELGIEEEEDHTLILQRELSVSGRNVCRINGRLTAASMLRQLGSLLIDIHGQNDNQSLMKSSSHIALLDAFGRSELDAQKSSYLEMLGKFKDLRSSLNKFSGDPKERQRLADLYSYQINEIDSSDIYIGEDAELNEKRMILANSVKITESLNASRSIISGDDYSDSSVTDMLSSVKSLLSSIAPYSEEYAGILSRVEEVFYVIEDIASDIRSAADKVVFDKSELEETEERINNINRLKRKYGSDIEQILEYADNTRRLLEELLSGEENVEKILKELERMNEDMKAVCEDLSFARAKTAKILENKVENELESLEMSKTKFKADIIINDDRDSDGYYAFTNDGLDKVEFMISANPGEPLKPLSRTASGGELSRIMLAVKTVLADVDEIPTLIFDEIDTGISGIAAKSVAQKLRAISEKHQVICVTHHAQIAAAADNNILISKSFNGTGTDTSVKTLDYEGKVREISRLLDGDTESEITATHAKELISKLRSN